MEDLKKTLTFELCDEISIDFNKIYDKEYAKRFNDKTLRLLKILTSNSLRYSRYLAGEDKDLQELVKWIEEYSRDPKNIEDHLKYLEETKNDRLPTLTIQMFKEKDN